MQAEILHREAAFLSNQLHTFAADDLEGVRPVIAQIIEKRMAWKAARQNIDYYRKFGRLPDEPTPKKGVSETVSVGGNLAELQVELSRLNVNVTKYEKKLREQPDHKKFSAWETELEKMKALKRELQEQIVKAKYARQQ